MTIFIGQTLDNNPVYMPYFLSNLGKSFTSTYNGGGPVYIGNTRYGSGRDW